MDISYIYVVGICSERIIGILIIVEVQTVFSVVGSVFLIVKEINLSLVPAGVE